MVNIVSSKNKSVHSYMLVADDNMHEIIKIVTLLWGTSSFLLVLLSCLLAIIASFTTAVQITDYIAEGTMVTVLWSN